MLCLYSSELKSNWNVEHLLIDLNPPLGVLLLLLFITSLCSVAVFYSYCVVVSCTASKTKEFYLSTN